LLTWLRNIRRNLMAVLVACGLMFSVFPISIAASAADRDEMQAYIDDYMNREMKEHHVPGAVVSIVENGKITWMRGYGYSDLERKIKADPYKTVFRLGSLSKSVTATAVMQLHEAGLIDLHEDIRKYDESLRLSYLGGKPVTMHHLLTHTSGFCESVFAVGRDKEKQLPLREAINNYLPALCRAPGEQVAYSNHGMALAGYLVEAISGKSYEEVVNDGIFKPLQMNHSNFRFAESDPDLARSYAYDKGVYSPVPYSYIHYLPAGALNSTAEDMARYMIAHLQQGEYEDSRIFSEQSADSMHRTQFTAHEKLPGVAYGFYERIQNGLRLIEHDGGIDGFQSYMYLIPSEQTGIFIATNSDGGGEVREGLIREYLNRVHLYNQSAQQTQHPSSLKELREIEGYYAPNRSKLKGPFNFGQNLSAVELKAVGDGVITWNRQRFIETEPYLFQAEDTGELIYMNTGQHTLALSSIPTMMYERQASVLFNPNLQIIILLSLVLVYPLQLVLALLRWLAGLIRRKLPSFDGIHIVVSALFIVYFLLILSVGELFIHGIPWWAYLVLWLPLLLLLTLVVRMAVMLTSKRRVTAIQYIFTGITAGFVAYLYSWSFFSL
jgi:CubicO group peptidase (beta-lactamase class C family)